MSNWELDYINLVEQVISTGYLGESRAGATYALPGESLKIPLDKGFPLITTRKMYPAGVIGELAAFVRGAEDLATYEKYGCNYWGDNAANWVANEGKPRAEWQIGKSYGSLWRDFEGIDQLKHVMSSLQYNPDSRRMVVSAWHPAAEAALPSCHLLFQLHVHNGNELHCTVYMRSVDLCVGLPSDIVLYALLVNLFAKDFGLVAKSLTFFFGNTHVYANHVDLFMLCQKDIEPKESPTLLLAPGCTTLDFVPSDVQILNYQHGPIIKYPFNA